jgi:hypothetical protein
MGKYIDWVMFRLLLEQPVFEQPVFEQPVLEQPA